MAVTQGSGPTVQLNASIGGFQSSMSVAAAELQRLSTVVSAGSQDFLTLSASAQTVLAKINPLTKEVAAFNKEFQLIAKNAQVLGLQEATAAMDRLQKKIEETRISIQRSTATDAFKGLSVPIAEAEGHINRLSLASSGLTREFLVLGHEVISGNWSRFGGSLVVLAELLSSSTSIMGFFTVSTLGAGAAVAVLGGTIAYFAYQAYEAQASIRDTSNHINLLGQGLDVSRGQVQVWQEAFRERFGETAGQTRAMTEYVNQLGASFTQNTPRVYNLVEAFKQFQGPFTNLTEATKLFDTQFGKTTESWRKGANDLNALTPAEDELVESMIKAKNEVGAQEILFQKLMERFGDLGDSIGENKKEWEEWARTVGSISSAGGMISVPLGGALPTPRRILQVDPRQMSAGEPQWLRQAEEAATKLTPELQKQRDAQEQLTMLKNQQAYIEDQLAGRGDLVTASTKTQAELQNDLNKNLQAQADLAVKIPHIRGAAEKQTHQETLAGYEQEVKNAEGNLHKIAEIRQREAVAVRNYYQANTIEVQRAAEAAVNAERAAADQDFNLYIEGLRRKQKEAENDQKTRLEIEKEIIRAMQQYRSQSGDTFQTLQPEKYRAEQDKMVQITKQASDQQFNIWVDQQHRRQILAFNDVEAQLRIEQETLAAMRARKTESGKPYTEAEPEKLEQEMNKVAQLQNTVTNTNYQRFAAEERRKIQEAANDWQQIGAIYQEWLARAADDYKTNSIQYQEVQREMVRASQRATDEAFRLQLRGAESAERLDKAYLETFNRNMDQKVKLHQITATQAAGFEIEYTAQLYAQLAAQYDAVLANETTKKEIWTEAFLKRTQLEADYARIVAGYQDKIAAASDKSAKQIEASFKSAFDQIGSSFSRTVEGLVAGTTTWQKAQQEMTKGLTSAGIGFVGTIANQLGGSLLAKGLNLTTDPGKETTITSVLSQWVTKQFGFGREDQNAALQKSQQDLTEVTKRSGEYSSQVADQLRTLNQNLAAAKSIGGPANITGPGSPSETLYNKLGRVSARGSTAGVDPDVLKWVNTASGALPEGYSVVITTGKEGHSTNTYQGGISEHSLGKAVDVRIVDAAGQTLPAPIGLSPDTENYKMYQRLGDAYINASGGKGRWGGYFTDTDVMHMGTLGPGYPAGSRAPSYSQLVKVDPTSVRQGVADGMKQSTQQIDDATQKGNTQLFQATNQDKQATDKQTQEERNNTQALEKLTQAQQQQASGTSPTAQADIKASTAVKDGGDTMKLAGAGLGLAGSTLSIAGLAVGRGSQTLQIAGTVLAAAAAALQIAAQISTIKALIPGFAMGGIIPSAAGGMVIGGMGGGQLIIGHPREMVLPSRYTDAIDTMISRGSNAGSMGGEGGSSGNGTGGIQIGDIHVGAGGQFLDGPSFQRWFLNSGGKRMVVDTVRGAARAANRLNMRDVTGIGPIHG